MTSGRWTAKQITELYLARIEAIDRPGAEPAGRDRDQPRRRSRLPRRWTRSAAQGTVRGPLHGVPILLKDNIATEDKTSTAAGSLALEGSIPPADSFVAKRLREAGAVILGKANLSEWANFRSFRASSGWSGRGRQCRNPYVLDRNPSGSSSGSAVAAAASMAAAAIGTETNGSIVSPASANGVVGVKPTVGLVSRARVIPISHSQDTVGPMSRTVRDAAIVLGALDRRRPRGSGHGRERGPGANAITSRSSTRMRCRARVSAWPATSSASIPTSTRCMEAAIEAMRSRGAVIVDPVAIPTFDDFPGVGVRDPAV